MLIQFLLFSLLSTCINSGFSKANAEWHNSQKSVCFDDSELVVSYIGIKKISQILYSQQTIQLGDISNINVCFPYVEITKEKILLTVRIDSQYSDVDIILLERLQESGDSQLSDYRLIQRFDSLSTNNEHVLELDLKWDFTLAFTSDNSHQIDVCIEVGYFPE